VSIQEIDKCVVVKRSNEVSLTIVRSVLLAGVKDSNVRQVSHLSVVSLYPSTRVFRERHLITHSLVLNSIFN
jgi:hypothetical protein